MDIYGLRDDLIETVARLIMFKDEQAKGASIPSTDGWVEIYNGGRTKDDPPKYSDVIHYNKFRAEVDGTVAQILNNVQKRSNPI